MGRRRLKEKDKRVALCITLSPKIFKMVNGQPNRSKYLEDLVLKDMEEKKSEKK